jgi:hypothetical protein
MLLEDLLRRAGGDGLDLHPSLGRCHHDDAGHRAVDDHPEVELPLDRTRLLHQDPLHFLPLRPRLVRHQIHPDDLLRELPRLLRRFGQLDAAALPTASRMNLGLDDDGRSELLGD